MATVKEIEAFLFSKAPKELATDWDNVGLLAGFPDRQVKKALIALDITGEVVTEAAELGAELIVSHHPVMNCAWEKVQSVRADRVQGSILIQMLTGGISGICMHTNLDKTRGGVNDALAARLGLEHVEELDGGEGILRVGTVQEQTVPAFAKFVKEALGANSVRFVDGGRPIRRVAVGGGACSGYFKEVAQSGCDAFVTADVQYDRFLDARAMGLTLIDAGHFPTENVVCPVLAGWLGESFPHVEIFLSKRHKEVISSL